MYFTTNIQITHYGNDVEPPVRQRTIDPSESIDFRLSRRVHSIVLEPLGHSMKNFAGRGQCVVSPGSSRHNTSRGHVCESVNINYKF
jgi:hypothetical protein